MLFSLTYRGFGQTMDKADTVILWPAGDGTFVMSQREPNGHKAPSVAQNPARKATLLSTESFANTTATRAVFSLSADNAPNGSTDLIWAFSEQRPATNDPGSSFRMHSQNGFVQLDLSKSLDPEGKPTEQLPGGGDRDGGDTGPFKGRLGIMLLHAICGAAACMMVIPAAVLVPRIARGVTRKRWWFPVHSAANGLVGMLLIMIAFQVAITHFHRGFGYPHRALGLSMFLIMCCQVMLGIGVHWIKVKPHRYMTASGRGWSNFTHMALGLICMSVGWATVWTGMQTWDAISGAEPLSMWFKIGWMVVISTWGLAYLAGLVVCLPRQLRAERAARAQKSRIDKAQIRIRAQSHPYSAQRQLTSPSSAHSLSSPYDKRGLTGGQGELRDGEMGERHDQGSEESYELTDTPISAKGSGQRVTPVSPAGPVGLAYSTDSPRFATGKAWGGGKI